VNFIAASVALLVVAVAATYIITVITFGIETCLGQPAMKLQNSVSEQKKIKKKERLRLRNQPAGKVETKII